VRWTSEVDGTLGFLKDFKFHYPTPRQHVISVVATDKDERMAFKSFPLEVKNFPPTAEIIAPFSSTIVMNARSRRSFRKLRGHLSFI
jgi:hypothetical protein